MPAKKRASACLPRNFPTVKLRPSDSDLHKSIYKMLRQLSHEESKLFTANVRTMKKRMTTGSACSGSEIARVSNGIIMHFFGGRVDNKFSCEKAPNKQTFIREVVEAYVEDGDGVCIFCDIGELGNASATCCKHQSDGCVATAKQKVGKKCCVPCVFFMSAGLSCKNMSKLFSAKSQSNSLKVLNKSTCLQDKAGSSGETLDGLLAYVRRHAPDVLVLENVEDILKQGPNHDHLLTVLKECGYAAATAEVISRDYRSPQRRRRAYIIAYKVDPSEQFEDVLHAAQQAVALAESLTLPPRALEDVLLPKNSEYLKSELARRQKTRQAMDAKDLSNEVEDWKEKNRKLLERDGISCSACVVPATHRAGPWYQTLTPRQKMVLGHAFQCQPGVSSCDVYQTMGREFISCDESTAPTLVPNSMLWLVKQRRLLTGHEALRVQCMPQSLIDLAVEKGTNDSCMADLSGNMFTATVYSAFAIAGITYAPLSRRRGTEASASVCVVAELFDF